MTSQELRTACEQAITNAALLGLEAPAIQLVVPREATGRRMRLLPGITAEVCCTSIGADGRVQSVVVADPWKILRLLGGRGV